MAFAPYGSEVRMPYVDTETTREETTDAATDEPYIPGGIFSETPRAVADPKKVLPMPVDTDICVNDDKDTVADDKTETTETAPEPVPEYNIPAYPADSAAVGLCVNGKEMPHGFAANVGGVLFFPLDDFCGLFGDVSSRNDEAGYTVFGDGFEVTVNVGEKYIGSRGRVLWGGGAEVIDLDGTICVPAEPLCRAMGLELVAQGDAATVTGEAMSGSADEVYDADGLYWLSHIISAESRGEPLEGQMAVGCVVLNRLKKLDYLSSIYEVVFDRRYGIQFSPAYSGSVYSEPTESCIRAAKMCLEGYSVSDSIMYFINSADTPPAWMVNGCKLIITIGHHDFYA